MKIAITTNGPGEFSGWVRPLLRALFERDPKLEAHVFFVPDDYATGREAEVARDLFPAIKAYPPKEYLRFIFGRHVEGAPAAVDVVQYLGGDLMHARRVQARVGGLACAYKFSKRRYRTAFARVFALDEENRSRLLHSGVPAERIALVGNLAVDGALAEAAAGSSPFAPGGILIMPGSRRAEIEHGVPFFAAVALRLRAELPGVPIAFGVSAFTTDEELAAALRGGGDPRVYGVRGTLERGAEGTFVRTEKSGARFPVFRQAMNAASGARLVVTIPGTKCIELAALGVPMVVCTPLNAPEKITINGVLTYLDRLPLVGAPLKRAAVLAVARRFPLYAQPNIDAGKELVTELRGTLTPGRVAAVAAQRFLDAAWLASVRAELLALYAAHAGAARRMADALSALVA